MRTSLILYYKLYFCAIVFPLRVEANCRRGWAFGPSQYLAGGPERGNEQQLATSSLLEQVSVLDLVLISHLCNKLKVV